MSDILNFKPNTPKYNLYDTVYLISFSGNTYQFIIEAIQITLTRYTGTPELYQVNKYYDEVTGVWYPEHHLYSSIDVTKKEYEQGYKKYRTSRYENYLQLKEEFEGGKILTNQRYETYQKLKEEFENVYEKI